MLHFEKEAMKLVLLRSSSIKLIAIKNKALESNPIRELCSISTYDGERMHPPAQKSSHCQMCHGHHPMVHGHQRNAGKTQHQPSLTELR